MGQTEPPVLHPVEDETEDSPSEDDGQDRGQQPAQVVSVAPHSELILLARVDADLELRDFLSRRAKLLTEERLRRFLLLGLLGVVVVDIRHSIFPV